MGTDTPLAVLSARPKLLYNYFKQNFAQVTNPPIDPIREELVMSLVSMIGPRPNLLGHQAGTHYRLEVSQPILTNADLEKIRAIDTLAGGAFRTRTLDTTWPAAEGAAGMQGAVERICREATDAVLDDHNILILSDRAVSAERIPIPALLATAAVHHHLIRQGLRTSTGLVVETGEAREVHHFCVLAGYGAEAINPYLAFETLEQLRVQNGLKLKAARGAEELPQGGRQGHAEGDVQDGHLHLPVLLRRADLRRGRPVQRVRRDLLHRHRNDDRGRRLHRDRRGGGRRATATPMATNPIYRDMLDVGGDYAFRLRGEAHAWTPESVAKLQHAVRGNSADDYTAFAHSINDQNERLLTIRGLMELRFAEQPVPLERGRARRRDRQAFRHRRDELRLDPPRGAHHAGDRDEPHRRQVEHRRGRRGIRSLQARCRTAIRCARRSSRSPPAGSASPPNTWSTPTICRSRWRRAPSPARAASCPATRSTRTSPGCATRRRASG